MYPLDFVPLRVEPLVLIASRQETRRDTNAILSTDAVIIYDRNKWGGKLAYAWLAGTGIRIKASLELDALDAIALMVDRGLGVSVVPDWASPLPEGVRLGAEDIFGQCIRLKYELKRRSTN